MDSVNWGASRPASRHRYGLSEGRGWPTGYRDALYFKEQVQRLKLGVAVSLQGELCVGCGERSQVVLVYALHESLQPLGDFIAPVIVIDLGRYVLSDVRRWLEGQKFKAIGVCHLSSEEVLRRAGYIGHLVRLVIPEPPLVSLGKQVSLTIGKIYKSMDSREREFDPERLIPGYVHVSVSGGETRLLDDVSSSLIKDRPSFRYRLGATKRHFLHLLNELRLGDIPAESALVGDMPAESRGACQPERLVFDGVVYTAVVDNLSDESGWADLLKTFCATFRGDQDVNLIVYLCGDTRVRHAQDFNHVLCALSPFMCRIIFLQGVMDEMEYWNLIAVTNIFIDLGRRKTLLPDLRRFAFSGVPVIACAGGFDPSGDEVLLDYPLGYSMEPGFCDCSDDPRFFQTVRRLDLESLCGQLNASRERVVGGAGGDRLNRKSWLMRQHGRSVVFKSELLRLIGLSAYASSVEEVV